MAVYVLLVMVVPAGAKRTIAMVRRRYAQSGFAIWRMLEKYRMRCVEGAEVVVGG